MTAARGVGLMLAIELETATRPSVVRRALLEHRLVLNATGPTTIRLLPPLVVSDEELAEALQRLRAALDVRKPGMTDAPRTSAHTIPPPGQAAERVRAQAIASYEANHDEVNRVCLLYSGGLDTSVMLKWIQDEYDAEVVTLTVNLGQPGEDYEVVEGKAKDLGAIETHVIDAREEFANDFIVPAIKANAIYGLGYPLFTALGRPLIAKWAVEIARQTGCDTIAHGCTGKGNDQVRIEATIATLAPELKVIAPVRGWQMGRDEEIAYAREHGIPRQGRDRVGAVLDRRQPLGPLLGGQVDRGHRARAGGRRLPARDAARGRARRGGGRRGRVRARRARLRSTACASASSTCSSRRRRSASATASGSSTTSRTASSGLKVRDIYEVPAATILLTAHAELEKLVGTIHQNQFKPQLDRQWAYLVYAGLWWEPLRGDLDAYMESVNAQVTGTVGLKLYKGSVRAVTRSSPNAVYDASLASFAQSGGLFSPAGVAGLHRDLVAAVAHGAPPARGATRAG